MSYEKYIHFSTEEFILDENFMQWVLHPNQENDFYWKEFLQNHPEKKQKVKEAFSILKSIRAVEPTVSTERLEQVYQNARIAAKPTRKIGWMVTKIAAVFLLLVSIGGLLFYLQDTKNTFTVESSLPVDVPPTIPPRPISPLSS